ncbi:MAG: hypothetical protein COX39_00735 [Candidatus Nealsonbacteria bacterium CG23_combo_of_CG06-09_8_20_14_all_40_13]|uniref:Rod shape-determining protein MreD n=1 Tax=Candidatus Nealsonbacteria bacterium CG23_combo_of_CG06-09_8_20_14_all_40_13 TaxID=1974724 RepID=A0A2G9YSZ3_9BACT|nr:MAG: hypothetical protein COX39_00735 [Candidatus Nealsonbacteria bacterium CG23_combo_of_CG06-09_8_20_14_all_40_13]PIR70988.1 MAG: hypothetical protein COU44_02120 [Candidatus Nealsonbacteria bacterium CG10_big_fil_rev_8_21_14_0_10_40_24]PIU43354.1 MAG: hypothetical protein COS97_01465 [Candidatus Nealsonbacteria bacterium CG07_land_8_20_14_0_80_40_10]
MAYFLILAGVLLRLLPHWPNFAPIAALGLFGGTYLNKRWALIIPLTALFLSDIFIGFYTLPVMLSVYGSFLLVGLLGLWLRKHKNLHNVVGASIIASILFYLITNFAVWAFTPWYSKDLAGLISCYFLALPFFRNTLAGDLFYITIMFGVYETVQMLVKKYNWRAKWLTV